MKKRAADWEKPSRAKRSALIASASGARKAAEYSTSLTTSLNPVTPVSAKSQPALNSWSPPQPALVQVRFWPSWKRLLVRSCFPSKGAAVCWKPLASRMRIGSKRPDAVEVAADAPLLVGDGALQERRGVEERGMADGPGVGRLGAGRGSARQGDGPEDGRADLARVVLVAPVPLDQQALLRPQVEVELHEAVEPVGVGRHVEVLLAAGRGEAARDERRDLRPIDVDAPVLVQHLERAEEERLVALDRAPQARPPLVALERRGVLSLDVGRIQGVVAAEDERRPLELVGPGAGDDVGDAPLRAPVLRLVAGGDDLELLDGVLRVPDEGPAVQGVVVVGPVHEEGERRGTLSEDRDVVQVAAGCAAGHGRRPRDELHEVHELAAVQGKRVDRLLRDEARHLRLPRIDEGRLADDLDGLLDVRRLQDEIEAHLRVEEDLDAFPDLRAEPRESGLHVVSAGLEQAEPIRSRGRGGGGAPLGWKAAPAHGHRGAGQDDPALVLHDAGDRAGDLGRQDRGAGGECQRDRHHEGGDARESTQGPAGLHAGFNRPVRKEVSS